MTSQPDPLRWWEDKQVEVTLSDGRRCRGWVRESATAPVILAAVNPLAHTPNTVIGRMIVTLLPEPDAAGREGLFPTEVAVRVRVEGEHGDPAGVRLLDGAELREYERRRARQIEPGG